MKHIITLYDWRDIKGLEGRYQVNQFGQVRNKKTKKIMECYYRNGYRRITLRDKEGHKKNYSVHRLVAEAFIPNPEGYDTVDHIDFNRGNNCVLNLRWLPLEENSKRRNKR